MGGCATKPKVSKEESAYAPLPPKEEAVAVAAETKEAVFVEKDVEVDEHGNKRQSLSQLLNEGDEKKDAAESDQLPVEQKPIETEKAIDSSETKIAGDETIEAPVEQASAEVVVGSPAKAEAEKAAEVAPAVETPKTETSEEKKLENLQAAEIQEPEKPKDEKPEEEKLKPEVEDKAATEKPETTEEQKTEEQKTGTETSSPSEEKSSA